MLVDWELQRSGGFEGAGGLEGAGGFEQRAEFTLEGAEVIGAE